MLIIIIINDRIPAADKFRCVFHEKSLRYAALGISCTQYCSAYMSTQPSILRVTVE